MEVLRNCDAMEHIASFLDNHDLGSLFETCQTVKTSINEISLWRIRAQELAKILRKNDNECKEIGLDKKFDCQSKFTSL